MPNFIVLRDTRAVRTSSPFERFGPVTANVPGTAQGAPEPIVEVHDISPREAAGMARDSQVAAVAIPMPIKLITPRNVDAGAAASTAWGVQAVKADTSPFKGHDVVVAVLDTGIDKEHPAFAGVTIVENDFSGSGNGDRQGHGTHCAGTIFGRDVNGTRI